MTESVCVPRAWHSLASQDCLWRDLSHHREWQLTSSSHQKQLGLCIRQDGSVDWKQVSVLYLQVEVYYVFLLTCRFVC